MESAQGDWDLPLGISIHQEQAVHSEGAGLRQAGIGIQLFDSKCELGEADLTISIPAEIMHKVLQVLRFSRGALP